MPSKWQLLMFTLYSRLHIPTSSVMAPPLDEACSSHTSWPFTPVLVTLQPSIFWFAVHIRQLSCFDFFCRCVGYHCHPWNPMPILSLLWAEFSSRIKPHADSVPIFTYGLGLKIVRSEASSQITLWTKYCGSFSVFPDHIISHSSALIVHIYGGAGGSGLGTALLSRSFRNLMVYVILEYLCRFHIRKEVLKFCHGPSRVGIPGNELADRLAFQAANFSRPSYLTFKIVVSMPHYYAPANEGLTLLAAMLSGRHQGYKSLNSETFRA